jgi:hypothetical protein
MSKGLGYSSIRKENGDLVNRLRCERQKVPKHIWVFEIGRWITFLSVDEIRKLERVTDEEDGGIISDKVVVSLFSVEFDREATRITLCIC